MEIEGHNIVVTGGASGIGRALVERFAAEGAAHITVADISDGARAVAESVGGTPVVADLSTPEGNEAVIDAATESGPIDLLCLNAGIAGGGGLEVSDDAWDQIWRVNVMAHVWALRAAIPGMIARGKGYVLTTASAAGLLTNLGNLPYSTTKHAAVGLAEWVAITYGDAGIGVSCLCPQGVRTPMLFPDVDLADADHESLASVRNMGVIETSEVADAVVEGLAEERFLILPHPEVATYYRNRATDTDRWLAGMRRLHASLS